MGLALSLGGSAVSAGIRLSLVFLGTTGRGARFARGGFARGGVAGRERRGRRVLALEPGFLEGTTVRRVGRGGGGVARHVRGGGEGGGGGDTRVCGFGRRGFGSAFGTGSGFGSGFGTDAVGPPVGPASAGEDAKQTMQIPEVTRVACRKAQTHRGATPSPRLTGPARHWLRLSCQRRRGRFRRPVVRPTSRSQL